ncbi:alpha/beta fold hydrolase [Mycobacterium sp. MS1601]|uniref:alpha/beta fold hydrolase n=1 Tax=Mycobacterium sp. MS1601 TaxID=1936029 RepID=UPI0018D42BBA|nr:alpha/beta hydrolase [Mycobacterium sp. MS1601]
MTSLPGAGLLGDDVMVTTPGGRRLRTMVDGDGDTLVVLEAGLGASALYWHAVVQLLRNDFRVVAYDRAGMGGSDPFDGRRTLDVLAADLRSVIDAFPHRRAILVGHSWGGPIVRVAAVGRDDVAGLVLVDQSDENDPMFFEPAVRWQFAVQSRVVVPLARLGLLARMARSSLERLPQRLRQAVVESSYSPRAAAAVAAEEREVVSELSGLLQRPLAFGDLPIRVISGQRAGRFERRMRAELVRAHLATAQAHAGAEYVPARTAGHMVPISEPELIAAQVIEVAQAG